MFGKREEIIIKKKEKKTISTDKKNYQDLKNEYYQQLEEMEPENQKLNVRFQHINKSQFFAEIKHTLRLQTLKATNNQVNQNLNYFMDDLGEVSTYTNKDFSNKLSFFKNEFNEMEELHQKLYSENHFQKREVKGEIKQYSRKLDKSATHFQMVVLTNLKHCNPNNPQSIQDHLNAAKNTMDKICETFGTQNYYLALHLDEKGLPHIHAMIRGFNSQGKYINISKNKNNGALMQDFFFEEMKKVDKRYKRGTSKEKTQRKHLTTEQYKEFMESKDLIKQQKQQIKELESKNKELNKRNQQLTEKLTFLEELGQADISKDTLEYIQEQKEIYKEDKMMKRMLDYYYRLFNSLHDNYKIAINLQRIGKNYNKLSNTQKDFLERIFKDLGTTSSEVSKVINNFPSPKP